MEKDNIKKKKKKNKEPELKRLHIAPILIIMAIVVVFLSFLLIGQKQMMNSYVINVKCREATIQAEKLYWMMDGLENYEQDQIDYIYGIFTQIDSSIIGLSVKENGQLISSSGNAIPEELYEYVSYRPNQKGDWREYENVKYGNFGFVDNSAPIFLDENGNNWIYKGILADFDREYCLSPINRTEMQNMYSFTNKVNRIRGYQDIWFCFSEEDFDIYMGYSVPMTDNDFMMLFMFAVGYQLTNFLITLALMIIFFRVIGSQHKVITAYYADKETGGKNWYYLINNANKKMKKNKNSYAMVQICMEKYQTYCSCYGEKEGKLLIRDFYRIMKETFPKKTLFARHERADFGIFVLYENEQELTETIYSLINKLQEVRPEASLNFVAGVYIIKENEQVSASEAYNLAAIAATKVVNDSSSTILYFSDEMKEEIQWERKVELDFASAIKNREFEIYLQPKYDVKTEKPVAAEALVRWNHPTEGFLTPYKFIPIFEKNGLILQLDDYMIAETARIQAERKAAGKKLYPISVNISRTHFIDENLATHICNIVDRYEIPRDAIELELTESAFFDDKDLIINTVNKLKSYDFTVSLDDFGSGYSSLNSLRELPIDIVKLDAGFFRGEDKDDKAKLIIKEIISLAKQLGMKIVSEGIEQRNQVDFLSQHDCDLIQGFYFAKPMPLADFEKLVD